MSAIEQPAVMFGRTTLLVRRAEDVGCFRHEVHTAEDDVVRLWIRGGPPGQLEGIAALVSEADHVIALIVVAEDDEALAQLRLRRAYALDELRRVQPAIFVGNVLLPARERELLVEGDRRDRVAGREEAGGRERASLTIESLLCSGGSFHQPGRSGLSVQVTLTLAAFPQKVKCGVCCARKG